MAFQPVEATARVELVQLLQGQVVENTLYFRRASDYELSDLTALATFFVNWWDIFMQPLLSEEISLTSVKATALHDSAGPQAIITDGLPLAGSVPSDPVPNNCAACISLRTANIGRNFRGRNYIAGFPKSEVNGSTISSTLIDAITAAYVELLSGVEDGNQVIVTRVVNGVVQSPSALTTFVTNAFFVTPFVRSQRRRTPGSGT
jgi:hypothetical protein